MKARQLHANLHLLDRQVISADDGHPVCKIDDLELTFDEQGRPYVVSILTGPLALGPRLGGLVGRLMVAVTELFRPEEDPGPQRLPMRLVSDINSAVTVGGTPQEAALEHWARVDLIAPLPGSGAEPVAHDRRPARIGEVTGELRMSTLLGRRVLDADDRPVGQVADVRLRQDGPMLGDVQHAFRVDGLIVVPRHTGRLFGYERGPHGPGPALVRALIRGLHRDSRYVTWDQVDTLGQDVRLSAGKDALLPLADLYRPGSADEGQQNGPTS